MKPVSVTLDDERPRPDGPDQVTYHHHLARYQFALGKMAGGEAVLDAGCGTGYGTQLLRGKAISAIGIDYSPLAVAYAREHFAGPGVAFAQMDCQRLAFPTARFDLMVCFEVFEHMEDQDGFLVECRRVLRPGGTLILSTPNGVTAEVHMRSIGQKNPFHIGMLGLAAFRRVLRRHFHSVQVYGQRRRGNRLYSALRSLDVFNLRLRLVSNERRERVQRALEVPVGAAAVPEAWVFERSQLRQANQFLAICKGLGCGIPTL
jgi:2-polyprenyl-3-methyl-5-hydroxy-6-metoxy-1,4-benzoquinol methylase